VVETSSVGTIEDALADSMMTVVVVAEVVAADGGVAGAAADLMTTIATIANNIGATTASAVSIAGGAPLRLCLGLIQEAQLLSPHLREFFRACYFEQLPGVTKVRDRISLNKPRLILAYAGEFSVAAQFRDVVGAAAKQIRCGFARQQACCV
jgi:hypothetical protein